MDPLVPSAEQVQTSKGAEALFRDHAVFVASCLVRLGAPRQDVEDLLQEVFLVAHRRGGYVAGPARPTTWLAEIALRVVANRRRGLNRRADQPDTDAIEAAPSRRGGPFEAAAAGQALARVQRALDVLDLERRTVFILYELEGDSCESIAAAMQIPLGTVYSRLHNARRQFRDAYAELQEAQSLPSVQHAAEGGAT